MYVPCALTVTSVRALLLPCAPWMWQLAPYIAYIYIYIYIYISIYVYVDVSLYM